ncbi:hypothetical protein GF354_02235 [Candidatus Peregrinibacteria bacterium]|nr:hypothetical protein [Candidatus Peregrinibacteria bacterium]
MLEENLIRIGLSKTEVKVYLHLLGIGSQAVSIIASECSLNRTTAYSVLKSLLSKGFVAMVKKNNITYYSSNDPNCIVTYLEKKAKSFDFHKTQLKKLIPKIRKVNSNISYTKPHVEYREGIEAIRYILLDELQASPYVHMFLPLESQFPELLNEFISIAIDLQKDIKIIAPDTKKSGAFFAEFYSCGFSKANVLFLKNEEFGSVFASSVNIYKNKLIMFNFVKRKEYAVSIDSKELHLIQKKIFQPIWNLNEKNTKV